MTTMKYTKNNPLRVVTLCSGYDSQCLALNRLREAYPDFDYTLVAWSEWDPESSAPTDFLASDKFKTLSVNHCIILKHQHKAMGEYMEALKQRIELECDNNNKKEG